MDVEAGLTIADAARASGLGAGTPRSCERARLIGDVGRAGSGHRRCADLVRAGGGDEAQRLALLEEQRSAVRAQLTDMRGHLALIERKISIYEERLNG